MTLVVSVVLAPEVPQEVSAEEGDELLLEETEEAVSMEDVRTVTEGSLQDDSVVLLADVLDGVECADTCSAEASQLLIGDAVELVSEHPHFVEEEDVVIVGDDVELTVVSQSSELPWAAEAPPW